MQWSDDVLEQARGILAAERDRLRRIGVAGDLVLVGGSSLPGALTKGDVDLHLRVEPGTFATAVTTLRDVYDVVHAEIWCATLATFAVPGAALATGVAVTPTGSEHDVRFTRSWQALRSDPALLREYNALKSLPDAQTYEARKSAFFDRLMAT